jgi:hypothetical protein
MMLNKLDDAVAPNICVITLFVSCIAQLVLFYFFEILTIRLLLAPIFVINLFFAIKVSMVGGERHRVYKILKTRIEKRGYDKSIFNGKCSTICLLWQAIYISSRFQSFSDWKYFWQEHKKRTPQYVIEDEALETILNKIDITNVKYGQVIHEFKK